MNILHITTYNIGGAGRACYRLHRSLLRAEVNSKLLVLEKDQLLDVKTVYAFESDNKRLKASIKEQRELDEKHSEIEHLPSGVEPFKFPFSIYLIENHPLYEWADIIHLHWVAYFLNWPTFFKKNSKPIVWTLHDCLPFTGGYHHDKGFPFESYLKYVQENIVVKKQALKNHSLHIVPLCDWLKKKISEQ